MNNDIEQKQNSENYIREEVMLRDHLLKKAYPKPDVQEELRTFLHKRRSNRKPKGTLVVVSFLSGAAAAILTLFILHSWDLISFTSSERTPIVAFQADNSNHSEVTLQQAGGSSVIVGDSSASVLAKMGVQLSAKDKQLAYNNAQATQRIVMQTLTTPRHKTFKVVLSDGTEVWMNADSKLVYPNKFEGHQRVVHLQGEAYFKVAHNAKCPFVVRTNQLQTRVLGTEFNLRNYSQTDTHVTLLKGSVEVSNPSGSCKQKIKPGENAELTANNTFNVKQVDTDEYTLWRENYFYFDNVSLLEITKELGRWYNVEVVFNSKKDLDTKVFLVADRLGTLQEVIDLINDMKKAHLILRGNQIIVE